MSAPWSSLRKRREENLSFLLTLANRGGLECLSVGILPLAAVLMNSEATPRCVERIFQHSDTELKPKGGLLCSAAFWKTSNTQPFI